MAQRNPLGSAASLILAVLGAGAAAAVVYAVAKPATTTKSTTKPTAPTTGTNGWTPVAQSVVPAATQAALALSPATYTTTPPFTIPVGSTWVESGAYGAVVSAAGVATQWYQIQSLFGGGLNV